MELAIFYSYLYFLIKREAIIENINNLLAQIELTLEMWPLDTFPFLRCTISELFLSSEGDLVLGGTIPTAGKKSITNCIF